MDSITKIKAIREGGSVKRCHIMPIINEYDVAQHSYNVLSLLLVLNPNMSANLTKAALWHDVAERWLGDVPATAKWTYPSFAHPYEAAEDTVLEALSLKPEITEDEKRWLKGADMLELWMFCIDQLNLGNRNVMQMKNKCEEFLLRETTPKEITEVFRKLRKCPIASAGNYISCSRLSDFFVDNLS